MESATAPSAPGTTIAAASSYAQERVWLAGQLSRDVPTYHVAERFAIHASVTPAQMTSALARLAARHASLRTAFTVRDGRLLQIVHDRIELLVRVLDLAGQDSDTQAEHCDTVAEDLMYASFDLDRAPLWRAAAIRLGDGDWLVPFVAHHAVCDPASLFNLHAELTELCAADERGRDAMLPHLPGDYADYAERQRARFEGPGTDASAAYWRRTLDGLPAVHGLPTDRPRPAGRTFRGAEARADLPAVAAAASSDQDPAQTFTVLLAAYLALVYRRSGQTDVVVGVPVVGRDTPELRPMVGTFVNMVALRVDAAGDPTFAGLAERGRLAWLTARDHAETPFQKVVDLVGGRRVPGAQPVYQLGFNLLTDRGFGPPSTTAEDDLLLEAAAGVVRLEYSTALFDADTARGMLDDYIAILAAGTADPTLRLSRLPGAAPGPRTVPAPIPPRPRYRVPGTRYEALVADLWSEVLDVAPVGADDGFFDLGGTSLQALRVLARLSAARGGPVAVQAFFAHPTVAGFAAELQRIDARSTS